MSGSTPLSLICIDFAEWANQLNTLGRNTFAPRTELDDPSCAMDWYDLIARESASLQVWLDIHGSTGDADALDEAMRTLREQVWRYDHGDLIPRLGPRENDDVYDEVDQLLEAIGDAVGRLEDLDQKIPGKVWEGYDE
jgi:hypothetical protein